MAAAHPGPLNTFLPSHEASGKLVIDFGRDIKKFAVNRYTQIVEVKKMLGAYLEMTIEEAGRIIDGDGRAFLWPDGMEAPLGAGNLETFEYREYRCQRRTMPFTLGNLTVEQASWDIVAQNASIAARRMMTLRTLQALTALTTSGNYASAHVMDVASIAGNTGKWDQSTTARQDLKRSLLTACDYILNATLSAIDLDDLVWVIGKTDARKLAVTQEIVDYIKGSPEALAQIRGELPGSNTIYGLPDKLYGLPVVVEKTVRVTSKKGATRTTSDALPSGTSFICARPGGLEGVADAPNFSTCVNFMHEEMAVETMDDRNNRRVTGRITENYVHKLVAPASGVLFQSATTS